MSEGERPTQSRRYCTNCGAELREGTGFCVSCGTPVNRGAPASPGPDHSAPPPPTPPRSLSETLRESFSGLTRLFSNASSPTGGATLSELANRVINWFRYLPSVPKLILVGVLLLLLLTVLSPIARVVAIIAFVVSAALLVIRAIQRGPIKGWGIAALASFVLIFVFGGISGLIYGFGSSAPDYEVDSEISEVTEGGNPVALFHIGTSNVNDRNVQAIVEDMMSETRDYDSVIISIYDGDEARFENGEGLYSTEDGELYSGDVYEIWIAHTPAGERIADGNAQVGRYSVKRRPGPGNSETEDYNDSRYYDYEEAGTGTNDTGTNEVGSPSGDSAGVLESMIRGGMMDGDQAIEDVRISGESAVVVVASDVSSEYAQSVCDFALEAAQSYDNQSGYGDSPGITQVSVKKPWRPWNETGCSS